MGKILFTRSWKAHAVDWVLHTTLLALKTTPLTLDSRDVALLGCQVDGRLVELILGIQFHVGLDQRLHG